MKTRALLSVSVFLGMCACSSTPKVQMEAQKPPIDESVLAKDYQGNLQRLLVIAPKDPESDRLMSLFEREFLRVGITIVSPGMVARVLHESQIKVDEALSEADRALVVAKHVKAGAILQITEWRWSKELGPRRFFALDKTGDYREVTYAEYREFGGLKLNFPSQELRFQGRLLAAESGEVIASFDVRNPSNHALPARYVASVEIEDSQAVMKQESFKYSGVTWQEEARKNAEIALVKFVATRLANPKAGESLARETKELNDATPSGAPSSEAAK